MAGNRRPLAELSQPSHPRRPLAASFQPSHPPTFARAIAVANWYDIAYEQVNGMHRPSRCARSLVRSCKSQEFFILRVLPDVLPYEPEAMTGRVPGVARSRESGDGGSPRPRPGEDHPRAAAPKLGEKNGLLAARVGVAGVAADTGQPSTADIRSLGGSQAKSQARFVPAGGTGAFFRVRGEMIQKGSVPF